MTIGPNRAASELASFFLSGESEQGMSSSWTALVGIAQGGSSGFRSPEAKVVDGRYGLGPKRNGRVSEARTIRAALLSLPARMPSEPNWADVLFQAHGPVPWRRILDEGLGQGEAERVGGFLELRLLGVALLTEAVRQGYAAGQLEREESAGRCRCKPPDLDEARDDEGYEQGKRARERCAWCSAVAWGSPGGWLAVLARAAGGSGKKRWHGWALLDKEEAAGVCGRVGVQAAALLGDAEAEYRRARGIEPRAVASEERATESRLSVRRPMLAVESPSIVMRIR